MEQSLGKSYQHRLLGALLTKPQFVLQHHRFINPDMMFDDEVDRQIASLSLHYIKEYGEPPPIEDLMGAFDGFEDADTIETRLQELYNSDIKHLGFLGDMLEEVSNRQLIKATAVDMMQMWEEGKPAAEIMSEIQNRFVKARVVKEEQLDTHDLESWDKWYDEIHEPKTVLPLGYPILDSKIGGGVEAGTLSFIVVGAKGGKSSLLLNFCINLQNQGYNGVHFSFENKAKLSGTRYQMNLNSSTSSQVKDIKLPKLREAMQAKLDKMGKLSFVKYPKNGATIYDLEGKIASMGYKVDYIVVDYAMIMRPTDTSGDRRDKFAQRGDDLAYLADKLGIPIITAWQGNRDSKNKMGKSGDLDSKYLIEGSISIAECYDIICTADLVLTWNQDEDEYERGEARLWISESRVGESKGAPILYAVDYSTMTITELHIDDSMFDDGMVEDELEM